VGVRGVGARAHPARGDRHLLRRPLSVASAALAVAGTGLVVLPRSAHRVGMTQPRCTAAGSP
jgi:hypothetical protein